jgi:uncharacterized membrane protein YfcA
MISETIAATAPVITVAGKVAHKEIHINGLPILVVVVVLVIAGVLWSRRRSRTDKKEQDRPGEWQPRYPDGKPENGTDDPPCQ